MCVCSNNLLYNHATFYKVVAAFTIFFSRRNISADNVLFAAQQRHLVEQHC